jgi:5-methylcytosine-specific restriction endonuclease McrBC regulatory subunit McrC
VSVREAVGIIATPTLELEVRPKIRQDHLLYLFEKAAFVPAFTPDVAHLKQETHMLNVVAQWFITALERVLEEGLARDYRLTRDQLPAVRGRPLPLPTASLYYSGRLSVVAEYEEFDFDTPLNRLLREASRLVLSAPGLPPELRRRSRRAMARLDGVGPLQPGDLMAAVERRTAHYRSAAMLAKRFIHGAGFVLLAGQAKVWTFLIRTPGPVEAGIRAILSDGLKGVIGVRSRAVPLSGGLTLHPDLVFGDDAFVADVKYKFAPRQWASCTSDLYEVVAFAAGLRADDAALVTFARTDQAALPAIQVGDIRVDHLSWMLDDGISPEAAAMGLVAQVGEWLGSKGAPPVV